MYVVYTLYIILSVYINVAVGFDDFSNKIFLVKKKDQLLRLLYGARSPQVSFFAYYMGPP